MGVNQLLSTGSNGIRLMDAEVITGPSNFPKNSH